MTIFKWGLRVRSSKIWLAGFLTYFCHGVLGPGNAEDENRMGRGLVGTLEAGALVPSSYSASGMMYND